MKTEVEEVDELIGRTIGSYRVEKPLGKGGMGAVYMAVHPVIGSRVAIKFLHPQYAHEQKIVDRFFNEARAVNVIGHDNILKILDLNVTEDDRHYFIMEFLHGRPLQALLKGNQPVPLDVTGPILLQCCDALEAAHKRNIVHRDLKPDNIYLITLNGKKNFVKVVDFGIARLTNEEGASTGNTQTGVVMGTPSYMSPEQGSGAIAQIDGRSDIYSLGVVMYQLASGKLPFNGANFGEVLIGHLQKAPPPLPPEVPEQYAAVILKCLNKLQEDRYQSMRELKNAIGNCMDELGIARELPQAEPEDEDPARTIPVLPHSDPALRTPARRSNPSVRSRPSQSIPPRKKSSRLPLILGLAGGAVAAAAIAGFVLLGGEAQQPKPRKTVASIAPATPEPPQVVSLAVSEEPADSTFVATWKDGSQTGTGSSELKVPRNAKVHFEFSHAGFTGYSMDLIADDAQPVHATLQAVPQPVAEAAPPQAEEPKKDHPKRAAKSRKAEEKQPAKDGLIDLDDSLK